MSKLIYLDNAATTPCSKEVLNKMQPYFSDEFANPSGNYSMAYSCANAINEARANIAALIGANEEEIIFTSGGTESDNLAIKGTVKAAKNYRNHIITSEIEHKAILYSCKELQREGFYVSKLPVDRYGFIDPLTITSAINKNTRIVSVMMANNEIGTIEPITAIGKITQKYGVLLHTDAVQAFGQIPIDVNAMNIDLLSMSSHKIHGPKGVGALYVRKGTKINSEMLGGGQERGMRAGTENVAGIVGFGEAARIAKLNMKKNYQYVSYLRDRLIYRILNEIPYVRLNGSYFEGNRNENPGMNRLPGNVNFTFEGLKDVSLPMMLDSKGICASNGSACSSLQEGSSHVLRAIGLSDVLAAGSVRITIGTDNTIDDIEYTANALKEIVAFARNT